MRIYEGTWTIKTYYPEGLPGIPTSDIYQGEKINGKPFNSQIEMGGLHTQITKLMDEQEKLLKLDPDKTDITTTITL